MKLKEFLGSVDEMSKNIYADDIVVEHRHNNSKREFLFVNKSQCKHIAGSPTVMIAMCKELVKQVNLTLSMYHGDVLVIAFAETATAIGNIVADNLDKCTCVLQTTREEIDGIDKFLSFEEEHSHATTHSLYIRDEIDINSYDYILFIDDEISTGKTILNFIDALNRKGINKKYGVASICNWQNEGSKDLFKDKGIDRFYLLGGNLDTIKYIDWSNVEFGDEVRYVDTHVEYYPTFNIDKVILGDTFKNERIGHKTNRDLSSVYNVIDRIITDSDDRVRIIGTEEFMYIPIKVGEYIENNYECTVLCHATTRSCIDTTIVNRGKYAFRDRLVQRYRVPSIYDYNRDTFIYNLNEPVDKIIIITDKQPSQKYLEFISNTFGTKAYSKEVFIIYVE